MGIVPIKPEISGACVTPAREQAEAKCVSDHWSAAHAGAVGVGQLMPVTADWVAASLIGEPELDRYVVEDNIRMSARYLDWLLDRNDGDVRLALGGYFQGPTSVARGEWLDATETYVANVEAQRSLFVSLHD